MFLKDKDLKYLCTWFTTSSPDPFGRNLNLENIIYMWLGERMKLFKIQPWKIFCIVEYH